MTGWGRLCGTRALRGAALCVRIDVASRWGVLCESGAFWEPGAKRSLANTLTDMDAEIEALEKRRAKTTDLKQVMMQELLTARTRLV
jgi:hypothetical protein